MSLIPRSHTYFSFGLKLHYVEWGCESTPTLLLIHGGRDHCRSWDWVAERLAERYHIVAPDLRGHGDSEWSKGGAYSEVHFIQDVAQLVHQKALAPLTVIGHSLGGSIALLYAGVFPQNVTKLVAIEGLGRAPQLVEEYEATPTGDRLSGWIEARREGTRRVARKYTTLAQAAARMCEANARLSEQQARHLTIHGTYQNEDGSYSWKFDREMHLGAGPGGMPYEDQYSLWRRIACPVLLIRGTESWASDPDIDGRARHFQDSRLVNIEGAGHWVHHDRLDEFTASVRAFFEE